jgi:molybdopterin converting factor small subunit
MQDAGRRYVYLRYVGHVAFMTGKIREAVSVDGVHTISDLLSKLDETYPGLKETFMPPGGVFNSRTGIIIRRVNQSRPVINEDYDIEEGDIVSLW